MVHNNNKKQAIVKTEAEVSQQPTAVDNIRRSPASKKTTVDEMKAVSC